MTLLDVKTIEAVDAAWVDDEDELRLHVNVRTGEGHMNYLFVWQERCLETHAKSYGCGETVEEVAAAWLRHNLEELPGSFKVRVVSGEGDDFESEVADFYTAARPRSAPTLMVVVPPAPKKSSSKSKDDDWTELLKWIRDTEETK